MQDWLAERLDEYPPAGPVLELFAGSGNFTAIIADRVAAPVTAVDSFAPALEQLTGLGLPGIRVRCLDMHRAGSARELAAELAAARLLVLDPPREGLRHAQELLAGAARLETALYVSCDLATFARDSRAFIAAGFSLVELQPLDLFPHTPHVETLAVLRR